MSTNPTIPTELIERLRLKAKSASEISRMMAESKSLRQESNPEGRLDLYSWTKPEETDEWQAADTIQTLREALEAISDKRGEYDAGDLSDWEAVGEMTDIARQALTGGKP
jgi:Lhr-like helicase